MAKAETIARPEVPIRHYDPRDANVVVYEVYPRSKKTVYYLRGSQAKDFSKITLDGCEDLPSGLYLYKSGYGFGRKGWFLLSAIKKYVAGIKPAALVISKKNIKSIKGSALVTVTLPYAEVHNLLVRLGRINEDNNNELRGTVASFLSTKFPTRVRPTHISEACTINTSGFDFRQGQTPTAGGFWCAGLLHRVREQGFTQPAPIDTTCPSLVPSC
jgi:hypothetical protein